MPMHTKPLHLPDRNGYPRPVLIMLITAISVLLGWSSAGMAQDQPKFRGIASHARLNIDNLAVDKVKREIRLDVDLAITEGILEYLLVGNEGKTYESVFKIQGNRPSDLNFALLLIGCEPIPFEVYNKHLQTGGSITVLQDKYPDSFLRIRFFSGNQPIVENDLINDREKRELAFVWAFTGSYFDARNRYAADMELSYIGIWPDPAAVINLVSTHKNPYRGEGGFEMDPVRSKRFKDKPIHCIIQKVSP